MLYYNKELKPGECWAFYARCAILSELDPETYAGRSDFAGAAMSLIRSCPVVLAGFALVVLCQGDETAVRSSVTRTAQAIRSPSEFRGAGSCSATACHGGIVPSERSRSQVLRNEHTTWISDDKHSRAYQVLFNDRSARIAKNLANAPADFIPAHQDLRCLACHTTFRQRAAQAKTSWIDSDGVGCEACHGASAQWLGPHTADAWRSLDSSAKSARGFTNTKELVVRALMCAGCHVGEYSADGRQVRDVNHDLIAAGHPRLNFELSAFLDNMPNHWQEKGPNADPARPTERAADFPARAWVIGRLATLRSAVALLRERAGQAELARLTSAKPPSAAEALPPPLVGPAPATDKAIPWPEFTEYGCFSCHHDLRDEAWRKKLNGQAPSVRAGSPTWGSWTLPLTESLIAQLVPESVGKAYAESMSPLSKEMAKTLPDTRALEGTSRAVIDVLDNCLALVAERRLTSVEVERLITGCARQGTSDRSASWDEAAQRYLALVPLRQAWIKLAPEKTSEQERLRAQLEELRSQLVFPANFESPRGFNPSTIRPAR